MALSGLLSEVGGLVPLIELALQFGDIMCIAIESQQKQYRVYTAAGGVVHAEDNTQAGVSVVYEALALSEGTFTLAKAPPNPPAFTIHQPWNTVLLEILQHIDESRAPPLVTTKPYPLDFVDDAASNQQVTVEPYIPDFVSDEADNQPITANPQALDFVSDEAGKQINFTGETAMANIKQALAEVMNMDGALAVALVDWNSGMTLGTAGTGINIEVAAAGNTNVVRSKMKVMKDLGLKGGIEDILITLDSQYHLIRLLSNKPNLFLYVALNRAQANLGLARHQLLEVERELSV